MKKIMIFSMVLLLLVSSAAAYVSIDSFKADQFSTYGIRISSTLDISDVDDGHERFKVIAMIPEFGIRTSAGPFDPISHHTVNKALILNLPDSFELLQPGDEVVVRYHVKTSSGKKRTKHRILIIE